MTRHQRRALVRVLRDEAAHCVDRDRLLVLARQWLCDHRLLRMFDAERMDGLDSSARDDAGAASDPP
jgi:hypothetical protein